MMPRLPGVMPAAARFSSAVLLERPEQTSTPSHSSVAPLDNVSRTEPGCDVSHLVTRSFQSKLHAAGRHRGGERSRDLAVEEWQQRIAPVYQMHFHADRSESARIFAADHARADDRQPLWQCSDTQQLVRVMHAIIFKRELGG